MLASCYTAMPDERDANIVYHVVETLRDCTHPHAAL